MLCAKRKLTGEIVTAYLSSKTHGPFRCPDCGDEVILKTGRAVDPNGGIERRSYARDADAKN